MHRHRYPNLARVAGGGSLVGSGRQNHELQRTKARPSDGASPLNSTDGSALEKDEQGLWKGRASGGRHGPWVVLTCRTARESAEPQNGAMSEITLLTEWTGK